MVAINASSKRKEEKKECCHTGCLQTLNAGT